MSKTELEPVSTELSPPIAAFVEATNAHDTPAFLATFTKTPSSPTTDTIIAVPLKSKSGAIDNISARK